MQKHFNTAVPVHADQHYCIDPLARVDWEEVQYLIQSNKFFVLHAPRQTGKTSTLLSIEDQLNQSGEYIALYINVEAAQAARNNIEQGMRTIASRIVEGAKYRLKDLRLQEWLEDAWKTGPTSVVQSLLSRWSSESDKPIVLLIDEVDAFAYFFVTPIA